MIEAPKKLITRGIRASEDLAEMFAWIARLSDSTVAELLDEIARPEIERRYALIRNRAEQIKALETVTETDDAPVMANELGGEG